LNTKLMKHLSKTTRATKAMTNWFMKMIKQWRYNNKTKPTKNHKPWKNNITTLKLNWLNDAITIEEAKTKIYICTFQKKLKKLQTNDINNSNLKQKIKNVMCPQRLVTMYCNKLSDTMCSERHSCLGKTASFTLEQV
jgi:hypothetical protein